MPESNLPAQTSSSKLVNLRVGEQELSIPERAQQLILNRTTNGWEAAEIATMGRSSVFVIRDASGVMRLIRKAVQLREANKEIANLAGTWVITVPGYNRLNQIAGIHIVTPPSIIIKGVEHANPHVLYKDDQIRRVITRKIGIGYSPAGSLVAIDTVRHYNFDAYYMQDLHKKTEKPAAAKYGTSIVCAFDEKAEILESKGHIYAKKDGKVWTFKKTIGLEGIWIDPSHSEIREVNKQHIAHQKFGDVIAQNMCSRNVLKAHPLIAAAQVTVVNGIAEVVVYGYRNEMTQKEVDEIGTKIMKGEQLAGVKVVHDEAEETFEQVQEATTTEIDESAATGGEQENNPPQKNNPEEGGASVEVPHSPSPGSSAGPAVRILQIAKEKDLDLQKICGNVYNKPFDSLTEEELPKLLSIVEKIGAPLKGSAK